MFAQKAWYQKSENIALINVVAVFLSGFLAAIAAILAAWITYFGAVEAAKIGAAGGIKMPFEEPRRPAGAPGPAPPRPAAAAGAPGPAPPRPVAAQPAPAAEVAPAVPPVAAAVLAPGAAVPGAEAEDEDLRALLEMEQRLQAFRKSRK